MIVGDSVSVDSILAKILNVHKGKIYYEAFAHVHGYETFKI